MVLYLNILEGVEFNSMQFIGPLVILLITMIATTFVYSLLFKSRLHVKIFNFFIGQVALFGAYLWAFPMGFYDFFK